MAVDRATGRLVADRYELRERLGRGGMGVVWRAFDTLLQRQVAVKTLQIPPLLDDADRAVLGQRVLREARAAARLNHPGVVTLYDVVEDEGEPVIIMELVESPTLAELVRRQGPLPPRRAAAIGLNVLDALAAAHAQGILHRDVKPANMMVPERGTVRLSDFGVAALLDDPKITTSGAVAGSPSYMAPEQATGEARGPAADLWSLGASLYFAVEGEPPFDRGSAIATLTSIVNDEPRPATRAGALGPVLDRLLTKDPAARPTVEELRRLLADVAGDARGDDDWTGVFDPAVLSERRSAPDDAPRSDGREPAARAAAGAAPTAPAPTAPAPTAPAQPEAPQPQPQAQVPQPQARPVDWQHASPPRPRPLGDERSRKQAGVAIALAAVLALVVALLVAAGGSDTNSPRTSPTTAPAGDQADQADQAEEAEEADQAPSGRAVPADWTRYTDPATGFTISHPPEWRIRTNGTLTDFVDPESGAYLRVDHVSPPGPSPVADWYEFEPRFAAQNPGYRRIRITPTTYAGYTAAIWEFTYGSGARQRHAVDLGFIAGRYGFALNFDTRSSDWQRLQPEFEAFKASFKAPPS